MRPRWRQPLLAALTVAPSAAHAADLWGTGPLADSTIQATDHFELRYHDVPTKLAGFEDLSVEDYVEQVNRLNLLLASPKNFSFAVQIDEVALWGNRYYLDDLEYADPQLYDPVSIDSPWKSAYVLLEKWTFTKKWRPLELSIGDVYASFGRGIALNLVKNTDIDIDTSIRGAKAVVRAGDVEATLVSGITNRQQISQDNPNEQIRADVHHMVTGFDLEHYALGPIQAGVHGVAYVFGRDDWTEKLVRYGEPVDVTVGGLTLGAAPGGVDLFAEGDVVQYRSDDFGADGPGYAAYGSASLYPGKTVVTAEVKRSKDTERMNTFTASDNYEVASIPTLEYERAITEDSSSTVNSNDLAGARVRVDYAITPGVLTPYASLAAFYDRDVLGSHLNRTPEAIAHAIVGVQWMKGEGVLQLNAGYRVDERATPTAAELEDDPLMPDDLGNDRLAHTDGEIHFGIWGHNALELIWSVEQFHWGRNSTQQADFVQMANAVSWYHGEEWVFVLYQDFSDNPLLTTTGNLAEDLYGAAEIQWQVGTATDLRLFYGAYKDGIRCSGGQCRKLPGFEGARLTFNGRF
jgi:hypothetical protein